MTSYTSILLGPDSTIHAVKRFSIVPLDRETAVAIIVTDNGRVENRLFNVPEGFTASDIEKMVNILNERLVGTPLINLQKDTYTRNKDDSRYNIFTRAGELYTSFQKAISIAPEERFISAAK